jgi:uncharacterized damage-inducible protein DinB
MGRLSQTERPNTFICQERAMKPEEMRELLAFNTWANQKIFGAVAALSAEQLTKDLGSSFPSVQTTLRHIAGVEWVWLERAQGRSPDKMPEAEQIPDLKTLQVRWAEVWNKWQEYGGNLTQELLDEIVDYRTFSFGPGQNPRWQMLQHMVNHGTYHRGQVTTMLRQLGAKGVGMDLITFYQERAAAAGA